MCGCPGPWVHSRAVTVSHCLAGPLTLAAERLGETEIQWLLSQDPRWQRHELVCILSIETSAMCLVNSSHSVSFRLPWGPFID